MILFFSGTGNSRYMAELIAKELKEELVSINQLLKKQTPVKLYSERPWIVVCPTYAWRIPRVVSNFIESAAFDGNRKIYFILTCGSSTLNSISYIRRTCEEKGLELTGFSEIIMPDNYILLNKGAPTEEESTQLILHAENQLKGVLEWLKYDRPFPEFSKTGGLVGKVISGPVNAVFYAALIDAKGFSASAACIGCGKCAQSCPLNNIVLNAEQRPCWGKNCTHCMSCIGVCPVQAVEYKRKTQGKRRYYLRKRVR